MTFRTFSLVDLATREIFFTGSFEACQKVQREELELDPDRMVTIKEVPSQWEWGSN